MATHDPMMPAAALEAICEPTKPSVTPKATPYSLRPPTTPEATCDPLRSSEATCNPLRPPATSLSKIASHATLIAQLLLAQLLFMAICFNLKICWWPHCILRVYSFNLENKKGNHYQARGNFDVTSFQHHLISSSFSSSWSNRDVTSFRSDMGTNGRTDGPTNGPTKSLIEALLRA
jgi:hypothetical protein